jgi:hypothetical protein
LTTTIGSFIRLCLMTMPWISRAIWSAPPPVPAGTTNSTGLLGSQAQAGKAQAAPAASRTAAQRAAMVDLGFDIGFTPGLLEDGPGRAGRHFNA